MLHPLPAPSPLDVTVEGDRIPALIWRPEHASRAVVLALHGGSGQKASPAILAIAGSCCALGIAVVAIDGPVHGERSIDGNPRARRFQAAVQASVARRCRSHDRRN